MSNKSDTPNGCAVALCACCLFSYCFAREEIHFTGHPCPILVATLRLSAVSRVFGSNSNFSNGWLWRSQGNDKVKWSVFLAIFIERIVPCCLIWSPFIYWRRCFASFGMHCYSEMVFLRRTEAPPTRRWVRIRWKLITFGKMKRMCNAKECDLPMISQRMWQSKQIFYSVWVH